MKIFYHRDMDGKCAAAIIYHQLYQDGITPELIDIDYKDTINLTAISPKEKVWIVDFSFKPKVMEEVLKITQNIIWIDHHKTALEYKYSQELDGLRDVKFSGCELTWQFIHPTLEMPRIVEMLGRYDVWDFSKYKNTLNLLQAGIILFDPEPENKNWFYWFFAGSIQPILDQGEIALKYRNNCYSNLIKNWSFGTKFEGYNAICCNIGSVSSQLFDSVKEDYDLMIPFVFDGNQWTISLYSKKDIDCSEIAKKYGGGGHYKAAGFQCKELPFQRDEIYWSTDKPK